MKVEVTGRSEYMDKVSKKGKEIKGFFVSFLYEEPNYNGRKAAEQLFRPEVLAGYVPEKGDILELNIGFGGWVNSVTVLK